MGAKRVKQRSRSTAQRRAEVARIFAQLCRERGASGSSGPPTTLQGVQNEIAAKLQVSATTISKDLKALDLEWREERIDFVQQQKDQALATLQWVEDQARAEWERSQQAEQVEAERDANSGTSLTTRYRKNDPARRLPGDPRYLAEMRACVERRAKIVGFEAAAKMENTGPGGGPMVQRIIVEHRDGHHNHTTEAPRLTAEDQD